MNTNPQSTTETKFAIPTTTRLGHVRLTVKSLDRQISFYTQVLGFKLHRREGAEAALGTEAEILLRLTENSAGRRVDRTTGMYHFALIYPSRKELARAIARLFALRYPNAPTDHGVSKTTYLDDLEGNTIELYIRSLEDGQMVYENGQFFVRYPDGRIGSGRDPLDVEALFRELDEKDRLDLPLPEGTRIGHVHLYGSSLQPMLHFYRDVLGFQENTTWEQLRMWDVGLDEQQPHVVAFNTWKGTRLPAAPADALGMRYFTIVLPNASELQRIIERVRAAGIATEETSEGILVRDPSQIGLILTDHMLAVQ